MSLNTTEPTDLNTEDIGGYVPFAYLHFTIAAAVAIVLCVIGLVGNIIVLWYLCNKFQKNNFTIYSKNLAASYIIFLLFSVCVLLLNIHTLNSTQPHFEGKESLYLFIEIFYDGALYSGMFILTTISLESCISVKSHVWRKCHSPKMLSVTICVMLWLFGYILSLSENLVCTPDAFVTQTARCTAIQLITFALAIIVCLPIMIISSLILLIRIKRIFNQQASTELYAFIISAVIVFILSIVPFNFLWFLLYFNLIPIDFHKVALFYASIYGTVLNCTIIPYLYIIAEIKWKSKSHISEKTDSITNITSSKTDSI